MWKNMVAPDTPQMKICVIRRIRIACWITKAHVTEPNSPPPHLLTITNITDDEISPS